MFSADGIGFTIGRWGYTQMHVIKELSASSHTVEYKLNVEILVFVCSAIFSRFWIM